MVESPFHDLLLKQSAARLREMLTQADEQLRRVTFEREYIAEALAEKTGTSHDGEVEAVLRTSRRSSSASDRRRHIRRIMETAPTAVWIPSAVRDQIISEGVEVTTPAVRAIMKRMLDDHELQRPADQAQGFQLASRIDAPQGASPGFSSNGTTEPPLTATGSHSEM
jgi:hypothetical protein